MVTEITLKRQPGKCCLKQNNNVNAQLVKHKLISKLIAKMNFLRKLKTIIDVLGRGMLLSVDI